MTVEAFGWTGGGSGGGGGTIGGGGTLNTLAMFTPDGTHIGNSILHQTGTTTLNIVSVGSPAVIDVTAQATRITANAANLFSIKDDAGYMYTTRNTNNNFSIADFGSNTYTTSSNIYSYLSINNTYTNSSTIVNFGSIGGYLSAVDAWNFGDNSTYTSTNQTFNLGRSNTYVSAIGVSVFGNSNTISGSTNLTVIGDSNTLTQSDMFVLGNNNKNLIVDGVSGFVGINNYVTTASLDIIGSGIEATTYGLKVSNNTPTLNFYVRDDGAVSSTLGLWIDGVRKLWTDTNMNTVFWNHANANPLAFGSSTRNTVVGNSDSNQPQFTTGGFNSVFGSFSGVNITSGTFNLVLGNYNTTTPTTGSSNIILGAGGMNDATLNQTLTFNGISHNANEVIFGSESYARYNSWSFGQGRTASRFNVGAFDMNWYATSTLAGGLDQDSTIPNWIFNASQGTGTGIGGNFVWNTAPAGLTGVAINPFVEAFRITQGGDVGVHIAVPLARFHNFGVNSTGLNQRLEPITGVTEDISGATVMTSDSTPTTLQTISIPTDTVVTIKTNIKHFPTTHLSVILPTNLHW